jgi:hypothetical protein
MSCGCVKIERHSRCDAHDKLLSLMTSKSLSRSPTQAFSEREGIGRNGQKIIFPEGTVRNYLSVAIAKLGASNRVDAARIARTKGWL